LDQGGERHADQEFEAIAGRLDEGVDADVGRDVVGGGAAPESSHEHGDDRRSSAPRRIRTLTKHEPALPGHAPGRAFCRAIEDAPLRVGHLRQVTGTYFARDRFAGFSSVSLAALTSM